MQSLKNFIFKKYKHQLIFIILTLFCILFYYTKVIFLPPSHIHLWTQSDRYALSLGFLENGFNFFTPQTYNLATINGITGVDFPINEYLIALLMKLFNNNNPAIFRIYNLIIAVIGYWVLYKYVFNKTKQIWKGLFVVAFSFTIPIITYYQCGFLPTSSSFSFSIIGLCYYFYFLKNGKNKFLCIAVLFLTLASLCRTPFVIYLFAVVLQQIYFQIKNKQFYKTANITFAISGFLIIAWQLYKYYLNKKYGSQFLTSILPASNFAEFIENTKEIIGKWFFQLFTISHYIILFLIAVFAKKKKKERSEIFFLIMMTLMLFVIYFILMNKQFIHHEYYFIDSFYIAIVFLVVYKIELLEIHFSKIKITMILILILSCLILSKKIQNEKYSDVSWDYAEISRKGYENGNKFLDSLKIPLTAKILVIDAFAFNYPLIQLNRKGFALIDRNYNTIEKALNWNYDYLIVQKKYLPSEIVSIYPKFLSHFIKVASNENLILFKKNEPNESNKSFPSILDFKSPEIYTIDSSFNKSYWTKVNLGYENFTKLYFGKIKPNENYGPTLILKNKNNFSKLLFEGSSLFLNNKRPVLLCITLHKNGQQIHYQEVELGALENNKYFTFYNLFQFSEYKNNYDELRFFIANKYLIDYSYSDIKIRVE